MRRCAPKVAAELAARGWLGWHGHPGAAWALLGPDAVLRRTPYDTHAAAAALSARASDMPGIDFTAGNIRASGNDAEALAAFSATIDQQAMPG